MLKKCSKCLIEKELTEFHKDNKSKDGLFGVCKVCRKQYAVKYSKQYTAEHKEKIKQYRIDHKKEASVYGKQYYEEHKEEKAVSGKQWRKDNPDRRKILEHRRRARKAGNGGLFTIEEWTLLKEKYNYTCLCCNKKEPEIKLTIDHVIPLVKGGLNSIENIQPLCKSCNSSKHDKIIDYR